MENTFILLHNKCLSDWDDAVSSGVIGNLSKYPSIHYQGFFGYGGASEITPILREEAVSGLERLLTYVAGSIHIAQNRIIKMRGNHEAVVSYERIIEKEGTVFMSFLVIQVWRVEDNQWKLVREMAENI